MTEPHPDQQQLWNQLTATMIEPLIAIACNPHEEPPRRHTALQLAHQTSPNVCIQALTGLATSAITALAHHKNQPPTQILETWIRRQDTENHRGESMGGEA